VVNVALFHRVRAVRRAVGPDQREIHLHREEQIKKTHMNQNVGDLFFFFFLPFWEVKKKKKNNKQTKRPVNHSPTSNPSCNT